MEWNQTESNEIKQACLHYTEQEQVALKIVLSTCVNERAHRIINVYKYGLGTEEPEVSHLERCSRSVGEGQTCTQGLLEVAAKLREDVLS